MIRPRDAENPLDHYCSARCRRLACACDLCVLQRRKIQQDQDLAARRPTLRWRPFEGLAGWSTAP